MQLFHNPAALPKPVIAISACLAGERVRYDGDHKAQPVLLQTLAQGVTWVRFCPEVAAGFGVPRPPVQLRQRNNAIRVVEVTDPSRDRTDALQQGVDRITRQIAPQRPSAIILKARSPSCGLGSTPLLDDDDMVATLTDGLMARACRVSFPQVAICDEAALATPLACQAFALLLLICSDIAHCDAAQNDALAAHYLAAGIDVAASAQPLALLQQLATWSPQRVAQAFNRVWRKR